MHLCLLQGVYCRARNGPVEKTDCKHSPKRIVAKSGAEAPLTETEELQYQYQLQKPTPQRPTSADEVTRILIDILENLFQLLLLPRPQDSGCYIKAMSS